MLPIQERMLILLQEIDEICKKHDIKYFLFAGTSLGAHRHKGFIPWDDDTDIIMTLPDYEKFLSVIDEELELLRAKGLERTVDWLEKDPDYLLTYARYVDTSTTALQRHTVFGGASPGVKADIFCVVPTFSDEAKRREHMMDVLGFAEVMCENGKMMQYRPEGFYDVYIREKKKCQALGRAKYIEENLHELMHRADSECKPEKYLLFSGMMSNTKTYDASIFDEAVYVPFETIELPISAKNDLFTSQHISDSWPDLPPHVERPRHSMFIDMDRPYTDYIDLLGEKTDLAEVKRISTIRKENNLYERDRFRDVFAAVQEIRNLSVEMDTEARWQELKNSVGLSAIDDAIRSDADGAGILQQILDLFEPYYDVQQSGSNKTLGLSVRLSEEPFRYAIRTLIKEGYYYRAGSVIRTAVNAGCVAADDNFVRLITEQIQVFKKLDRAMYVNGDPDAVQKILDQRAEGGIIENTLPYAAAGIWLELLDEGLIENLFRSRGSEPTAQTDEQMIRDGDVSDPIDPSADTADTAVVPEGLSAGQDNTATGSGEPAADQKALSADEQRERLMAQISIIDQAALIFGIHGELLLMKGQCMERLAALKDGKADTELPDEAEQAAAEQKTGNDLQDQIASCYEQAMENVSSGYVCNALYEKGADINGIFHIPEKQEPKPDSSLLRTSAHTMLTGKSSGITITSDHVLQKQFNKEAKKRGIISRQNKKRYKEYRQWVKENKRDVEKEFNKYSEMFYGIEKI